MDKKFIKNIQKRVIDLLLILSDNLQVAAKDQCSELARLVGCWMLNEHPEYKVQIYKGELSGGLAHDILVVENDQSLFLLDPTIWQIFPESGDIYVGSFGDIPEAVNFLQKKYGGTWKMSEIMGKCDKSYQQELLTIIRGNK